jgi:hypothetical protein
MKKHYIQKLNEPHVEKFGGGFLCAQTAPHTLKAESNASALWDFLFLTGTK